MINRIKILFFKMTNEIEKSVTKKKQSTMREDANKQTPIL